MAKAPTWTFDLLDTTRAVLTHGLEPTGSAPAAPADPLTTSGWSAMRAEVDLHRLRGLLVGSVADESFPTTDEQRSEVAHVEVELTQVRMWQERRFNEVLELLERAGVETRVLKGSALAALDYPDPQWRPTGDLDLLVRGEQLELARDVLLADGGQLVDVDPTPGYGATIGKGNGVALADGLEVDLHRVLVSGAFGVRIRVDDLWDGPRSFELGDSTRLTLSPEVSLLHACYHLLIFGYPRALTLRDVGQLLVAPELDADQVLWLARRWRGEVVLATGLLMARGELGLSGSSMLLDWADGYAPTIRGRTWLRIEQSGEHISPLMAIGEYLALSSSEERALFRRATLQPDPGTWPRIETRVWRMIRRAARTAKDQLP